MVVEFVILCYYILSVPIQRNIQMGLSSVVLGFVGVYFSGELPGVQADGFFFGYNRMVYYKHSFFSNLYCNTVTMHVCT